MKFVFFGYDFMMPAVQRLLADGHELIGVFSFPCDNIFNFNTELLTLAGELDVPISIAPPQSAEIEYFIKMGCACFLAAGYLYKIPAIDEARAYGINLHPSLLPQGRGIMPTPHIIIDYPQASGFTIHKLTQDYDAGDILYQEPLPLTSRETVETLSARVAARAPEALSCVMADLPAFWSKAVPQDESKASTFKMPDDALRTLDWNRGIDHIDRTARAFGHFGSLAQFDNALWIVAELEVWAEKHNHAPGAVIRADHGEILVAASDGIVRLKKFEKVNL